MRDDTGDRDAESKKQKKQRPRRLAQTDFRQTVSPHLRRRRRRRGIGGEGEGNSRLTSIVLEVEEDTVLAPESLPLANDNPGHNLLPELRLALLHRAHNHVPDGGSGQLIKTTLFKARKSSQHAGAAHTRATYPAG